MQQHIYHRVTYLPSPIFRTSELAGFSYLPTQRNIGPFLLSRFIDSDTSFALLGDRWYRLRTFYSKFADGARCGVARWLGVVCVQVGI